MIGLMDLAGALARGAGSFGMNQLYRGDDVSSVCWAEAMDILCDSWSSEDLIVGGSSTGLLNY